MTGETPHGEPMLRSPLFRPLLLAALLPLASCEVDTQVIYVDPVVDFGDRAAYVPSGKPTVDIGFYVEQLYLPLGEEDDCPVVYGLQGGTWSMPALRTLGIDITAHVICSVVTDGGEVVGAADVQESFVLATDGWLEIQALPIEIRHAPPHEADDIDDLIGQGATLSCTVTDDADRSDTRTLHVTLSEG